MSNLYSAGYLDKDYGVLSKTATTTKERNDVYYDALSDMQKYKGFFNNEGELIYAKKAIAAAYAMRVISPRGDWYEVTIDEIEEIFSKL